ncbi:hypothetical protein Y032_0479g2211 [Ancylostoma ceylanicum]|uniref:Uncharacterized protein n=1 Tax=Ancylostoma ceylanicum TaxID=53326 RepID=A0A016WXR6_9BILA|nr:hypothetical protein Y032_0479g2211 [Ancylostoma ceylanicum]
MDEGIAAPLQNASLFSLNPNGEHLIVGALYSLAALVILPLYITIIFQQHHCTVQFALQCSAVEGLISPACHTNVAFLHIRKIHKKRVQCQIARKKD